MFELNKQEVCVGEQSVIAFSQSYCECDIIVPDAKPDIAKLMQASANVVVTNKRCSKDRITIEGRCDINILYLSEYGTVCAINTIQNFSDVIDAKGVAEGMDAELEADLQNVDYNIINSRKLNVKMLIAVDANANMPVNCELCTGIASDGDVQVLKKVINPYNNIHKGYDRLTLKEMLELPAGKPDMDTILKSEMRLCVTNAKIVNDKIVIDGKGNLIVLYLDSNDNSAIQFAEYELPFSEVVEAPGAADNMNVHVKLKCEQLCTEICCDSDGDNRLINMECIMGVTSKVFCETELEIIEDAYSTKKVCNSCSKEATIDRLVACEKAEVTVKDNIVLPDNISRICSVYAHPNVSNTYIDNGKVNIEGVMEVEVLYMPENEGTPISSYKNLQKFQQSVLCDGAYDNMICDVTINVNHTSYNITLANELEVRVVLTIDAKVLEKTKINYISDFEMEEDIKKPEKCMIKVCFVGNNDRLWDIAKTYKTTVDEILENNLLADEDEVTAGYRLVIL